MSTWDIEEAAQATEDLEVCVTSLSEVPEPEEGESLQQYVVRLSQEAGLRNVDVFLDDEEVAMGSDVASTSAEEVSGQLKIQKSDTPGF